MLNIEKPEKIIRATAVTTGGGLESARLVTTVF